MKFSSNPFLIFLFFSSVLFAIPVDAETSYIQITIKNSTLSSHYAEVVDSICGGATPGYCEIAEAYFTSSECQDNRLESSCQKYAGIMDSKECVKGLIFSGKLVARESKQLDICSDRNGKGRIKTRNSRSAPWTLHSWVDEGSSISIR